MVAFVKLKEFPDKHWVALLIVKAGIGAGKSDTSTNKVDALDVPQEFDAVTEIVPELVELIILIYVDEEVPVQAVGNPQE